MAGWRGVGGNTIPVGQHGSGGYYGGQLSPSGTSGTNPETGQPVVTNVSGLPIGPKVPGDNPAIPVTVNTVQPYTVGNRFGIPGRPIAEASGNPGVNTVDPRGARGAEAPPWGAGESAGSAIPGGTQMPDTGMHVPNVLHEVGWRGGFQIANDKLWATDRHAILNAGTERGGGRETGMTDPPMDGPARPALRLVQRTINYQQGTDHTIHEDHLPGENRQYTMVPMPNPGYAGPVGNARIPLFSNHLSNEVGSQYIGEQGTGWSPVYGGVPGLWQPYGSYAGYTADEIKGIQSPVSQGSQGDGPQKVWSGPPHGLHSITYPDYSSTLGRYLAIPQMALPRIDRPANSTSAGQSFSQTVQPQGQTGTVAQQTGGAGSGVNWKRVSAGWRGIRPGGAQF